jgi:hypothetical protein
MIFHKALGITQCIATFVSLIISHIMTASYLGLMRDTDTKGTKVLDSSYLGAHKLGFSTEITLAYSTNKQAMIWFTILIHSPVLEYIAISKRLRHVDCGNTGGIIFVLKAY